MGQGLSEPRSVQMLLLPKIVGNGTMKRPLFHHFLMFHDVSNSA